MKQALLLTGTGLTNLAAVHATGLNKDEAKMHFEKALASGDEGVVGPAAEALEFCEIQVRAVLETAVIGCYLAAWDGHWMVLGCLWGVSCHM